MLKVIIALTLLSTATSIVCPVATIDTSQINLTALSGECDDPPFPYPPESLVTDYLGAKHDANFSIGDQGLRNKVYKWSFVDDCGTVEVVKTIVISDNSPPTITGGNTKDLTVDCDAVPQCVNLAAYDTCGNASLNFEETKINGSKCTNEYDLVRSWQAVDDAGLSTYLVQSIAVRDNTPPTIVVSGNDQSFECNYEREPTARAFDNCDSDPTMTVLEQAAESGNDCSKTLSYAWMASDECGLNDVAYAQITVKDTTAPKLIVGGDLSAECNAIPEPCIPEATDSCQSLSSTDVLTTVERIDGDCLHQYTLIYSFTVDDGCGNIDTANQTVTISDTVSPTLSNVPKSLTMVCDNSPNFDVVGKDNCASITVEYSEARINTTDATPKKYHVIRTWFAADDCGNSNNKTQTIYYDDVVDPIWNHTNTKNQTGQCSANMPALPTAEDQCCEDAIVVDVTASDTSDGCKTTTEYTYIAEDCNGNSITHGPLFVVVEDTHGPTFNNTPDDETIYFANFTGVSGEPTWDDNCYYSVEYSETKTDSVCPNEYSIFRSWYATDGCQSNSTSQTISVYDDVAPSINITNRTASNCEPTVAEVNTYYALPSARESACGASIPIDECRLEFEIVSNETCEIIVNVSVYDCSNNSDSGLEYWHRNSSYDTIMKPSDTSQLSNPETFAWSFQCEVFSTMQLERTEGCNNLTWTETYLYTTADYCGLSNSHVIYKNASDTIDPTWDTTFDDRTVECANHFSLSEYDCGIMNWTDNNGLTGSSKGKAQDMEGNCTKSFICLFNAEDDCANNITGNFSVEMEDNSAPLLTIENITTSCDANPDPCSGIHNYSDTCSNVSFECSFSWDSTACAPLPFVVSVSDTCGNSITMTAFVIINDTDAPVISWTDAISNECDVTAPSAFAEDDCHGVQTANITTTSTSINCSTTEYSWSTSAYDTCDNGPATKSQSMTYVLPSVVLTTSVYGDEYEKMCAWPTYSSSSYACNATTDVATENAAVVANATLGHYEKTVLITATDGCTDATASLTLTSKWPVGDMPEAITKNVSCDDYNNSNTEFTEKIFEVHSDVVSLCENISTCCSFEFSLVEDLDGCEKSKVYTMVRTLGRPENIGNVSEEFIYTLNWNDESPPTYNATADTFTDNCSEVTVTCEETATVDCNGTHYNKICTGINECGLSTFHVYDTESTEHIFTCRNQTANVSIECGTDDYSESKYSFNDGCVNNSFVQNCSSSIVCTVSFEEEKPCYYTNDDSEEIECYNETYTVEHEFKNSNPPTITFPPVHAPCNQSIPVASVHYPCQDGCEGKITYTSVTNDSNVEDWTAYVCDDYSITSRSVLCSYASTTSTRDDMSPPTITSADNCTLDLTYANAVDSYYTAFYSNECTFNYFDECEYTVETTREFSDGPCPYFVNATTTVYVIDQFGASSTGESYDQVQTWEGVLNITKDEGEPKIYEKDQHESKIASILAAGCNEDYFTAADWEIQYPDGSLVLPQPNASDVIATCTMEDITIAPFTNAIANQTRQIKYTWNLCYGDCDLCDSYVEYINVFDVPPPAIQIPDECSTECNATTSSGSPLENLQCTYEDPIVNITAVHHLYSVNNLIFNESSVWTLVESQTEIENNNCEYTLTRNWALLTEHIPDSPGVVSDFQTIQVTDTTAPKISPATLANGTIDVDGDGNPCGDISWANPNATDCNDISEVFTFVKYTDYHIGTWHFDDGCTTGSTIEQTFNHVDITPPYWVNNSVDSTNDECSARMGTRANDVVAPTANDVCGNATIDESVDTLTCEDDSFWEHYTWSTSSDHFSGNGEITLNNTIQEADRSATLNYSIVCPTLSPVECGESFTVTNASAIKCGDVFRTIGHDGHVWQEQSVLYNNETFTFTYATPTTLSNMSNGTHQCVSLNYSCEAHQSVVDTTPPTVTGIADATINCTEDTPDTEPTFYDICSEITVSYSETYEEGCTGQTHTIFRDWVGTDEAGLSVNTSQTVTREDITPPTLVFTNEDAVTSGSVFNCDPIAPTYNTSDDCCCIENSSYTVDVSQVSSTRLNYSYSFSVYDACGNAAMEEVYMYVDMPEIFVSLDSIDGTCLSTSDVVYDESAHLTVTGNECGANMTVTVTDSPAPICEVLGDLPADFDRTIVYDFSVTIHDYTLDRSVTAFQNITNALNLTSAPMADFITEDGCVLSAPTRLNYSICDVPFFSNGTSGTRSTCGNNFTRFYGAHCGYPNATETVTTIQPSVTFTITDVTEYTNCSGSPDVTGRYEDECGNEVNHTTTTTATTTACSGNYGVHFHARYCGKEFTNESTGHAFEDKDKPTWSSTLPVYRDIYCNETQHVGIKLNATDGCQGNLTYSPFGETYSNSNYPNVTVTFAYFAADTCNNFIEHTASYEIMPHPVILTVPEGGEGDCEWPAAPEPYLHDPCEETANETMVSTMDEDISDVCNSTRTYTFSYTNADNGKYVTVSSTTYKEDIKAPKLQVNLNASHCDGKTEIKAGDTSTVCTYECVPQDDNANASDCNDVTIEFTETEIMKEHDYEYSLERTYLATDTCGLITSITYTVLVNDTLAPYVNFSGNHTSEECNVTFIPATFQDDCEGGISATPKTSTIPGDCDGNETRIWSYSPQDTNGNIGKVHTYTIEISDTTAPDFGTSIPPTATIRCNETYEPNPNATDCNAFTIDYTTTSVDATLAIVNFQVTDSCGNANNASTTVTIVDYVDPYFNYSASTISNRTNLNQGECAPENSYVVGDECTSATPTVSRVETRICGSGCYGTYTISEHVVATDEAGRVQVGESYFYQADDTTPPEFTGLPADLTEQHPFDFVQWFDTSDVHAYDTDNGKDHTANITSSYTQTGHDDSCSNTYTVVYSWYVNDDCLNVNNATKTLVVEDTIPPVFDHKPSDMSHSCDTDSMPCVPTAHDSDGTETTVSETIVVIGGVTMYNWYTEDCAGNNATHTYNITKYDDTAPVLTRKPISVTVGCECEASPMPNISAFDNCDPSTTVHSSVQIERDTDNVQDGLMSREIRSWFVTDTAGNTDSHEMTVAVMDVEGPKFYFNGAILANSSFSASYDSTVGIAMLDRIESQISVSDDCDDSINTTSAKVTTIIDGDVCDGSALYSIQASDKEGNSETTKVTISWKTSTALTEKSMFPALELNCNGDITAQIENLDATDYADNFCGDHTDITPCDVTLENVKFTNVGTGGIFSATATGTCGSATKVVSHVYTCQANSFITTPTPSGPSASPDPSDQPGTDPPGAPSGTDPPSDSGAPPAPSGAPPAPAGFEWCGDGCYSHNDNPFHQCVETEDNGASVFTCSCNNGGEDNCEHHMDCTFGDDLCSCSGCLDTGSGS